ncbi:MAG: ubiquinol-cytochrome c reductase iron-sulfur subunit [Candidatus Eisenbacteria bacterium]|nr:ubiquinol-cytochrome c reductase iron-sulfur subunit [Candidatus Eisenbacteria bacterium]
MPERDEPMPPVISRRDFVAATGLAACAMAAAGAGVVLADFLRPRVLFEPPTAFLAGPPDAIEVGSVVTHVEQRVYVIRLAEGFRALSAVCTHLGCITRFQPDRNIIACPCHGSQFTLAGDVVTGPAPRALRWLQMSLSEKGELIVDTAVEVPAGTTYRF